MFQLLKDLKLIWMLISFPATQAQILGKITTTNPTIQQSSTFIVDIFQWSNSDYLEAGTTIDLTFPAEQFQLLFDYYANQLESDDDRSVQLENEKCSALLGFGENEDLQCTVWPDDAKITVELEKETRQSESLQFSIQDMINPGAGNGGLIDSTDTSQSSQFQLETESGSLVNVQLSNSNEKVAQYGTLVVQFEIQHQIEADGQIQIVFPKWGDERNTDYFQNPDCTLSQDNSVGTSTLSPAATCSLTPSEDSDLLTITNAFSSPQAPSTSSPITILIENVRNPASMRGANLLIQTQDSQGRIIDWNEQCLYLPQREDEVDEQNYSVSVINNVVNSRTDMDVGLRIANGAPQNSVVIITFPPEIKLRDELLDEIYVEEVTLTASVDRILDFEIESASNNQDKLIILDPFQEYKNPAQIIYFSISKIQTPYTNKTTQPFEFLIAEVVDDIFYPIEGNKLDITLQVEPYLLTEQKVLRSQRAVFKQIDITIQFQFKGILKQDNVIQLKYPEGFELSQDTLQLDDPQYSYDCAVYFDSIGYEADHCVLDTESRTIAIGDYLREDYSNLINEIVIICQIKRLFTNPSSSKPLDQQFQILIVNNLEELEAIEEEMAEGEEEARGGRPNISSIATYDIEGLTGDPLAALDDFYFQANPVVTNQFLIETQNSFTGSQSDLLITLMTYEEDTQLDEIKIFEEGFKLMIQLPEQVDIATNEDEEEIVYCTGTYKLNSDPLCQKSEDNDKEIVVTVQAEDIQINEISGQTSIQFMLQSIRNPWSSRSTDSFDIRLMTLDDYDIAEQASDLEISVSQGRDFESVNIIRQSVRNSDVTSYTFEIQVSNQIPNLAVLEIIFPPQIRFEAPSSIVECKGEENLLNEQTCTYHDLEGDPIETEEDAIEMLKINHLILDENQEYIQPHQIISLEVSGVTNPKSFQETESFTIKISQPSNNNEYIIQNQNEGITVTNSEVNSQYLLFNFGALNRNIGEESTFKTSYQPYYHLEKNSFIVLGFPNVIQRAPGEQVECIGTQNLDPELQCQYDSSTHSVMFQVQFTGDDEQANKVYIFDINGFKNPDGDAQFSESSQINFKTLDSNQYMMTEIILQLTVQSNEQCDENCETCGNNPLMCFSCYQDSQFPFLALSTCVEQCEDGQFDDSNRICQQCNSKCYQCSQDKDFCTQCQNSELLLIKSEGQCLREADIPKEKYYDSEAQEIYDCNEECTSCQSKDVCIECATNYYLTPDWQCVDKCPSSMMLNEDLGTCERCISTCKECSGSIDHCTQCHIDSVEPYFYENACLPQCPIGYIISDQDGTTCERENTYPFIILSFSIVLLLLLKCIKISKRCKKIQFKNLVIASLNAISLLNWFVILGLTKKEEMYAACYFMVYCIACSYMLNIIFYCLYVNVIRYDEYYMEWREKRICKEQILVYMSLLTSFQLYRIIFSHLSEAIKIRKEKKEKVNKVSHFNDAYIVKPKYADDKTVKTVFNILTIINISSVLIPAFISDLIFISQTRSESQLFWEYVENILITTFLLSVTIYDTIKKNKKVELQKLKKPGEDQTPQNKDQGTPQDLVQFKNIIQNVLYQSKQKGGRYDKEQPSTDPEDVRITFDQTKAAEDQSERNSKKTKKKTKQKNKGVQKLSEATDVEKYRQRAADQSGLTDRTEANLISSRTQIGEMRDDPSRGKDPRSTIVRNNDYAYEEHAQRRGELSGRAEGDQNNKYYAR